jgi:transposase
MITARFAETSGSLRYCRLHCQLKQNSLRQTRGASISTSGDVTATRCMGRSRGGLTTKIHAVVDADGNPIRLKLSEGQAHDGRSATDMLESTGPGQTLLADRGYDGDALHQKLADRGAWANVKPMPGRVNIPVFSPYLYRFRNLVERFFHKLKHFRAIATRFEKHDDNYFALVKLTAAKIWMRFMSR